MESMRLMLFQSKLGTQITRRELDEIDSYRPHFICFPEFFFVNQRIGTMQQTEHNQALQLKRMRILSRDFNTVVIGGTMPEKSGDLIHNTSFVFHDGRQLGFYRKKHLFFPEVGKITPGDTFKTFSAYGINFGVLICADVFHDESFLFMKEAGVSIVFIPTFSPKKEETIEEKFKRDREIYVRGGELADATLVKVCGVPSPFKSFLQARSLIADKNDILYRVPPDQEETSMIIKFSVDL